MKKKEVRYIIIIIYEVPTDKELMQKWSARDA